MRQTIDPSIIELANEIEQSTESWLVMGRAGTGKSTLLRWLRAHSQKSIAFLAPTGVAAINIGGETIHSFFGYKPPFDFIQPKKLYGSNMRELHTIVIDEISMVSPELLDAVDQSLRLNGPRRDLPFGGVQLVLVGDLYQLPPVVKERGTVEEPGPERVIYDTPYFFSAKILDNWGPRLHELHHIFRQTDLHFLDLLQAVRQNRMQQKHWDLLNERVQPDALDPESDEFIVLTTTNRRAQQLNERYLNGLSGPAVEYAARSKGDFPKSSLPNDEQLTLKEGAQIMFIRNKAGFWQNGSLGRVEGLEKESIFVSIGEGAEKQQFEVEYEKWEAYRMRFDNSEDRWRPKTRGTFWQLPVKLARAITIHKSQGKTYERAAIDLDSGAFAHGQLYVALSRCRTLENLILTRPIRPTDIKVDPKVLDWMEGLGVD